MTVNLNGAKVRRKRPIQPFLKTKNPTILAIPSKASQIKIFSINAKETIKAGIRNMISKWYFPWCFLLMNGWNG